MVIRKGRKISGGRYVDSRKRKAYEHKGKIRSVKLGEDKKETLRARGNNLRKVMLKGKFVNVGKKKLEIKNVLETPSDKFLARQNIITKGTIVQTDIGKVKITNRPSQEAMINGVLLKE